MDIKDTVVWITGGASGMGARSVEMFAGMGAKVMFTDIQIEKGQQVAARCSDRVMFVKADSTKSAELQAAVQAVMDRWGRLDVLLNCVGGGTPTWAVPLNPVPNDQGGLDWVPDDSGPGSLEAYINDININLIGAFDAARLAAWEMKKNEPNQNGERGVIIFISSISAKSVHSPGFNCGYSSAKAGILGLTKEMAVNLAPLGIRVNAIIPGFIDTPLVNNPMMAPIHQLWLAKQIWPKHAGDTIVIAQMAVQVVQNWFVNNSHIEVTAGFG